MKLSSNVRMNIAYVYTDGQSPDGYHGSESFKVYSSRC